MLLYNCKDWWAVELKISWDVQKWLLKNDNAPLPQKQEQPMWQESLGEEGEADSTCALEMFSYRE